MAVHEGQHPGGELVLLFLGEFIERTVGRVFDGYAGVVAFVVAGLGVLN